MSAEIDPAKLKVVELRAELSTRGLDTKGNKPVLVKRLKDALEKEIQKELPDTSIADTSTEDFNTSQSDDLDKSMEDEEKSVPSMDSQKEVAKTSEKLKDDESKASMVKEATSTSDEIEEDEEVPEDTKEASEPAPKKAKVELSPAKKVSVEMAKKDNDAENVAVTKDDTKMETEDKEVSRTDKGQTEEKHEENGVKTSQDISEVSDNKPPSTNAEEAMETGENACTETKPPEKKDEASDHSQRGDKRKRSPSPSRAQRRRSKSPIKEDEPVIDNNKVQLNWYDSDLHLQIDKESFLSGKPYHDGAFGYIWSGVRATHGANTGKVCYEVKITEELKWEDFIRQPDRGRRDRDRKESRRERSDRRDKSSDRKKSGDKSADKKSSKSKDDSKQVKEESKDDAKQVKEETKDDAKQVKEENQDDVKQVKEETKDDDKQVEEETKDDAKQVKEETEDDAKQVKEETKSDAKQVTDENKSEEKAEESKKDADEQEEDKPETATEDKEQIEETKEELDQEATIKSTEDAEMKEIANPETTETESQKEAKSDEVMEVDGVKSEEKKDDEGKEEVAKESKQESKEKDIPPIPTHLIRIGWSSLNSGLQLGESKFSYGYESSGKFAHDKIFADYAKPFSVGDVIGAYLEFLEDTINIKYTLNGEELPVATSIPRTEVPEENFSLFPHVLSRNYAFEVNLGGKEEPFFKDPEELCDYAYIDKFENKVLGPTRPETRGECEVIMMCGLPGSGKTHWVKEHVANNPDKRYTVIGNTQLLDKMTVNGNPLKNSLKGRWNVVLDKLSKCLNKLVEIAAVRRRNYVIDQTNVFPSAQRRKMRSFEGFKRRAVIVVCGDEEQARRRALQEAQDGKDVPNIAVYEMKANMSLPKVGDWLEEVTYVELDDQQAKTVVQKYNKEGKDNGFGPFPQRRDYRDDRSRWQQNKRNDYRGGYRDRSYQPSRFDRGSKHGGWQDRSDSWGRSERRDNRGSSNRSRDWRNNNRGSSQRHQDRGRDRSSHSRDSYSRNRPQGGNRNQSGTWQSGSGSSSGSWGSQGNWQGQGGGGGGGGGGGSGGGSNWNQNYGQGKWNYGQGGYGQQQNYGNYQNWNYQGQYPNWSGQVDSTTNWSK